MFEAEQRCKAYQLAVGCDLSDLIIRVPDSEPHTRTRTGIPHKHT